MSVTLFSGVYARSKGRVEAGDPALQGKGRWREDVNIELPCTDCGSGNGHRHAGKVLDISKRFSICMSHDPTTHSQLSIQRTCFYTFAERHTLQGSQHDCS